MDGPPRMVAWQPGQVGNEAAIPNNYQCRGFGSSSFLCKFLFSHGFILTFKNLYHPAVSPQGINLTNGIEHGNQYRCLPSQK